MKTNIVPSGLHFIRYVHTWHFGNKTQRWERDKKYYIQSRLNPTIDAITKYYVVQLCCSNMAIIWSNSETSNIHNNNAYSIDSYWSFYFQSITYSLSFRVTTVRWPFLYDNIPLQSDKWTYTMPSTKIRNHPPLLFAAFTVYVCLVLSYSLNKIIFIIVFSVHTTWNYSP